MNKPPDRRNIKQGWEIPTQQYSDQPYVVKTADGAWLCVVTTGSGHEGQPGQHIVSRRSTDLGKTWSKGVALEPPDGPEASYAVLLKVPPGYPNTGRIYCFYNHNTDNTRWVRADNPPFADGKCYRVDSQGHFVFKYSDDHGRTWSEQRYDVPMRAMDIDRCNPYGGAIKYFWNVGKPFIHDKAGYVSLHKVGGLGEGFFTRSEGVLLKSETLLFERDPSSITWETLPDGDFGLRAPPNGGPIAEEQSYVVLSDGTLYAVYRTIDGHPACAYSRDDGHTWSTPQYQRFANGRLMKHPRAANFVWKCANGKYVYWFHNHGGRFIREHPRRRSIAYNDRNPVWLCGGVEIEGPEGNALQWSQPELVLYDDDPYIRISYPDLIEDAGRVFLTETQKDIARVHELDPALLAGLWAQFDHAAISQDGLIVALPESDKTMPKAITLPTLPKFTTRSQQRADYGTEDLRQGFAVMLVLRLDSLTPHQVLLDNRTTWGQGWCVQTTERGTVEILLNDGRTENRWDCDPGMVRAGQHHHIAINVDGGPKLITFIVDGVLCDGGDARQFGWGRFSPHVRDVNGAPRLRIALHVQGLWLYNRYLRTSEAVAHYRATIQDAGKLSRL